MKKWTALILTVLLLCGCAPALALEEADVTGMWYLVSMAIGGQTYLPDERGVSVAIDLHEDGTATLISGGAEQAGKWSVSGDSVGVVDASGSLMLLKGSAMNLVMTMRDGSLMTFGRESVRAPRPVTVNAETPEVFYGTWQAAFMYTDEKLTYMETLGLDMRLRIDETGVTELIEDGDGSTWTTELINGMLVGSDAAGQPALVFTANTDGTISLYHPDGSLCYVPLAE